MARKHEGNDGARFEIVAERSEQIESKCPTLRIPTTDDYAGARGEAGKKYVEIPAGDDHLLVVSTNGAGQKVKKYRFRKLVVVPQLDKALAKTDLVAAIEQFRNDLTAYDAASVLVGRNAKGEEVEKPRPCAVCTNGMDPESDKFAEVSAEEYIIRILTDGHTLAVQKPLQRAMRPAAIAVVREEMDIPLPPAKEGRVAKARVATTTTTAGMLESME